MKFCRFYNKTMNCLESISIKLCVGTFEDTPRKNIKEINVFLGLLYIIFASMYVFVVAGIFGSIYVLLSKLYEVTTSHCSLEEKQ